MTAARTRIKFCGFTREQDVDEAVRLGADALGLVFYPKSPRMLELGQARRLRERVPAFVQVVCLFVNAEREFIQEVLDVVQPDLLQFHGEETPEECLSYHHPYLKAFRVGAPGLDTVEGLYQACLRHDRASGWLLDGYSQAYGGSGTSFDPELLQGLRERLHHDGRKPLPPLILAGGMRVDNVRQRLAVHRPYAIDVSSGVEDAPGIKNTEKMAAFMQQLRMQE